MRFEDGEGLKRTQELEGEVDGGVHDARAVYTDGCGEVADADGVQMLPLGRRPALDEDL